MKATRRGYGGFAYTLNAMRHPTGLTENATGRCGCMQYATGTGKFVTDTRLQQSPVEGTDCERVGVFDGPSIHK
jgi:hypothetical protein